MPDDMAWWLGFIIAAYLCGSIPFGLLIGKAKGIDIRQHGSGNIGATNAGRVLGKRVGALCFALDVLKGAIPVDVAGTVMGMYDPTAVTPTGIALWFTVAAAAMVGHMHPVWLRFKGGKGVATGFGALAGMWPVVSLAATAALLVWILSVRISRYVGISSCIAAGLLPTLTFAAAALWFEGDRWERVANHWPAYVFTTVLAAAVIWRHRSNIRRTLAGTEPKTTLFG